MKRLTLWLACCAASSLPAAFDVNSTNALGARSAGMGGADAAAPQSLEALLGNPAMLPEGGDILASLYGGMADKRLTNAFGLGTSIKPDLRLGLLYQINQDNRLDALTEQTMAIISSMELSPRLNIGARFKAEQLESGPLTAPSRGFGLDIGARQGLMELPFLPGSFSLGGSIDDVLSSWPSQAWAASIPATSRLGLGWQMLSSLYLGVEHAWSHTAQLENTSLESWRAGLQWQALKNLSLRGGWRNDLSDQYSAGLGLSLPFLGASAQYALLLKPEQSSLSHRLSLEFSFAHKRGGDLRVRPLQVLRNPETQSIRQARFEVTIDPALRPISWKLEIMDKDGKVARQLKPLSSSASALLDWNGRDSKGMSMRLDSDLKTLLTVETAEGVLLLKSDMTLDREIEKAELETPAETASDADFAAPELRPVFDKVGGSKISHVVVKMPDLKQNKVEAWKLDFSDSQEHLLRRLEGEGELPKEVVWDGKDAQGKTVENALGVQVKVEIQKDDGKKAARIVPLFSQKAYEIAHREAKARPVLQLSSLGLPLLLGRTPLTWAENDAAQLAKEAALRQSREEKLAMQETMPALSGSTVFLDVFNDGDSAITPEQEAKLRPLLRSLKDNSELTLVISGISQKNEGNHQGLAGRRAMELVKRLQSFGGRGLQIVLKTPEEYENARGVRVEVR